ncbi:hypothetical protein [Haloferax sp. Atlit-4N]|uniref:hypothetical protein n=1 Tax=Haloferax sp. Atlit-4N TaxID=2077206 RepID=UPI0011C07CE8|nr:hypothetical protein [Haloferax sp. Atlit-4N]
MSNSSGQGYDYDGWLRFNGLFFTEPHGEMEPEDLLEAFDEYAEGSPRDPSEGYRETELATRLANVADLSGSMAEFAENIYTYEFISEQWVMVPDLHDPEGQPLDHAYRTDHKKVELIWDFDDVLIFQGTKNIITNKRKELRGSLSRTLKIEKVRFDFDYLLWLLYQSDQGNRVGSGLRVNSVSNCTTTGTSRMGEQVAVDGASEVVRSVPFISALLEGNKIDSLEADMLLGNNYLVAEIDSDGWIHVKASREDMKSLNKLRQMGLAARFVVELLRSYESWLQLPRNKQYPPESFFHRLLDICEEEGYLPIREPEDLLREYERKRDGRIEGPSAAYSLSKFN